MRLAASPALPPNALLHLLWCAGATLALAACHDSDSASAAAPPRIEIKGTVAPIDSVTVSSPIEGQITRIAVAEGASVKTGDLLFTLTNPAVERELAYARTQVAAGQQKVREPSAVPPATPAHAHT